MFSRRRNLNKKYIAGLSLVELLVSIFVMMTIMAVVVYNHKNFTDNLEITNLAYSIALSIREAQISGISVRSNPDDEFESAFGVHFNINSGSHGSFPGNETKFLTFVDLSDDEKYGEYGTSYFSFICSDENPDNNECIKVEEIGRGNFISKICYRGSGVNLTCPPSVVSVDISFLRPKPDAVIRFRNSGGSIIPQDDKEAIICLESPQGRTKTVHVLKTGQISVRKENCVSAQSGGGAQL